MVTVEQVLQSPRLVCLADTQKLVGDVTSFEVPVAMERGGWVWHPFPKEKNRVAVVKITRRLEGLVWWHASLVHPGLGDA